MAWTGVENFDSYSTGDLAGGSGGSGWSTNWSNGASAQIVVSTTVSDTGSNSVQISNASGNTFYTRNYTASTSGDVYFAMYKTSTTAPLSKVTFRNASGGEVGSIGLDNAGNIEMRDNTPPAFVDVGTYTANTWYYFHVNYDTSTGKYKARWTTTGTWGSWTAEYDLKNTSAWTTLGIGADSTSNHTYVDSITDTDPFAAAGGYAFSQAVVIA